MLILSLFISIAAAKEPIEKPHFLNYSMDDKTQRYFEKSVDALFTAIINGKISDSLLSPKMAALTFPMLQELIDYESKNKSHNLKIQDKKLINVYPISSQSYFLTISFNSFDAEAVPSPIYTFNLIATKTEKAFTFAIPLDYLTRHWKTETVGNVTYHFRTQLNKERANIFNEKNSAIANKIGVKPEKFDFYMVDNYQEILNLNGFSYFRKSNGQTRDGYGVVANTIFSVMNNEDFSHDIFHYYSRQINNRENQNRISEEGIAYLWGSAYYTDQQGEMISYARLKLALKKYLSENQQANLFDLFNQNNKVFDHIAPEISVRSTISAMIANKIEKELGVPGLLKLINAGRKDRLNNYLRITEELIGLNKENFNLLVTEWLYESNQSQ